MRASPALELINSEFYDGFGGHEDLLEDEAWLRAFLTRWHLAKDIPSRHQRRKLMELRASLRNIVEALADDKAPPRTDLRSVNAALASAPLRHELAITENTLQIRLVAASSPGLTAELASDFAEFLVTHEPARLKRCENPLCRWVFYDESRNRRRRWCDSSACGNVDKVRRFRQRQRRHRAR